MDPDRLASTFPKPIELPIELRALCKWHEKHGYPISGYFRLREHDDITLRCWFGSDKAIGQLAQFGAGPDGSLYCIWDHGDGRFPIVHMGSEGQNNFVLSSDALEFLRLLAIGYDEIGFDNLSMRPKGDEINPAFQSWVSKEFGVSIPKTGIEITFLAQEGHERFQDWIEARCG